MPSHLGLLEYNPHPYVLPPYRLRERKTPLSATEPERPRVRTVPLDRRLRRCAEPSHERV